jgi:hypothetical protein
MQLARSGIDFTVLRSPIMNEDGSTEYRLTDQRPMPWATINRHAVAKALVDILESKTSSDHFPYITR